MPLTRSNTKTLDKARKQLADLQGTVHRWGQREAALRSEADDLEAVIGDRVLAAGEDGDRVAQELSAQVVRLRQEASAAASTAAAACRGISEAKRQVLVACATVADQRATAARQTVDRHADQVRKLLEPLTELEGIAYVPPPFPEEVGVEWRQARSAELDAEARKLEDRAVELARLAEQPDVTDEELLRIAAEVDPDGAEAQEVTARSEAQSAELEAGRVGNTRRDELSRRRTAAVEEAYRTRLGMDEYDAKQRATVAHNSGALSSNKSFRRDEQAFVDLLAEIYQQAGDDDAKARRAAERVSRQLATEVESAHPMPVSV